MDLWRHCRRQIVALDLPADAVEDVADMVEVVGWRMGMELEGIVGAEWEEEEAEATIGIEATGETEVIEETEETEIEEVEGTEDLEATMYRMENGGEESGYLRVLAEGLEGVEDVEDHTEETNPM